MSELTLNEAYMTYFHENSFDNLIEILESDIDISPQNHNLFQDILSRLKIQKDRGRPGKKYISMMDTLKKGISISKKIDALSKEERQHIADIFKNSKRKTGKRGRPDAAKRNAILHKKISDLISKDNLPLTNNRKEVGAAMKAGQAFFGYQECEDVSVKAYQDGEKQKKALENLRGRIEITVSNPLIKWRIVPKGSYAVVDGKKIYSPKDED